MSVIPTTTRTLSVLNAAGISSILMVKLAINSITAAVKGGYAVIAALIATQAISIIAKIKKGTNVMMTTSEMGDVIEKATRELDRLQRLNADLIDAIQDARSWLRDAPDAGRPSDDGIDEARNILRTAIAHAKASK